MTQLEKLIESIISRVNINLRRPTLDVGPCIRDLVNRESFSQFYAFYGLTSHHPLYFRFKDSSLAGTYFLGKCDVERSVLYKSDIRGDELKRKGSKVIVDGIEVTLADDEIIRIRDSFLIKTLVHSNSHDPENLEVFRIINTVALHYANIHGTNVEGCYLEPFATADLSMLHDCVVGAFSYVQAGDLAHERVEPGRIWVRSEGNFEFNYRYPADVLAKYISFKGGCRPKGAFIDFYNERKEDFIPIYSSVAMEQKVEVNEGALVSPYAVIKGDCGVGRNVLVAQRAYIENSRLGDGSNAQENCYIIDSVYEGLNVTAHGGKVIHCYLGRKVFTGFNSFLRGSDTCPVTVGPGSIIMPHTIIDAEEKVQVPENSLVWGFIRTQKDLERQSMPLDDFARLRGQFSLGAMTFEGVGSLFVDGFRHRIDHILEANGAWYDGSPETIGHAQLAQSMSYNILQPYTDGEKQGIYPTVRILP